MNNVILRGRLTKEPELQNNNGIEYLNFSLAVRKKFKNQNNEYLSDFINITAYREIAKLIAKWSHKGDELEIIGSIRSGSYEKNGKRIYTQSIIANEIEFVQRSKPKEEPKPKPEPKENIDNIFADFGDTVEVNDDFLD